MRGNPYYLYIITTPYYDRERDRDAERMTSFKRAENCAVSRGQAVGCDGGCLWMAMSVSAPSEPFSAVTLTVDAAYDFNVCLPNVPEIRWMRQDESLLQEGGSAVLRRCERWWSGVAIDPGD